MEEDVDRAAFSFECLLIGIDDDDFIVNAAAEADGGKMTAAVTTMMDAISKCKLLLLIAEYALLLVANLMVKMLKL